MEKMLNWFVAEESGQGLVEYGLIIALVSIALITILGALSGGLGNIFKNVTDTLNNAKPTTPTP